MPRPTKGKTRPTKATQKAKRPRKVVKRSITKEQFHEVLGRAARPTKKSKAGSK